MNDKLDRLKDIKIENFIWIIYIGRKIKRILVGEN